MSKLIRGVLYAKKENLKLDNKDIDDERQAIIQNMTPVIFSTRQKLVIMVKSYLPEFCGFNKKKEQYEKIFE